MPDHKRHAYGELAERRTLSRLADTLEQDPGVWIETDVLLVGLAAGVREPVPDVVWHYLRRRLDGEARKPRGRGRAAKSASARLRILLIVALYERFEGWLKERQSRHGLDGWSRLRSAHWWQGPPSERAARMVLRRLGLNLTWQRIRNIAFAHRRSACR